MATALMGYYAPSDGSDAGTWGSSWNSNGSTFLDNNFAGITSLTLASTAVALTAAQARNQMIRCTGTLLAGVTISPDVGVLWNGIRCIENLTSGSFALTLSNAGGSVVIPQGRRCVVFLDTSNGPRIVAIAGSATADPVPTGSKTIWYNTAAPSGWTAVAMNDYAIKIVTAGLGGVTSGSVAFSTLFGRTATDAHTLTSAEIPSHQHFQFNATAGSNTSIITNAQYPYYQAAGGNADYNYTMGGSSTAATLGLSSLVGGGGSHTHDIDMRVLTAAFTLASRD